MKKTWRILALVLALVLVGGALAACDTGKTSSTSTSGSTSTSTSASSSQAPKEEIHFAYIAPMTGDYAKYGQQMERGFMMYVDATNAAGGVNGQKINWTTYDDKNDPKESVAMTQKALEDEKLFCIFGPFSSTNGMAMAAIIQKAEVLQMGITCSHPKFTDSGNWIFRGCISQVISATNYGQMAYLELGLKKVYTITINNDWGVVTQQIFAETFTKLGGEVKDEQFIDGITDFTPMLSKAKDWGADAIYLVCMYNNASTAAIQARKLNITCQLMTADSTVNAETLKLGGEALEGAWAMSSFYMEDPRPVWQKFVKTYNDKYSKDGLTVDSWVANAYEGVEVVCNGIKAVGYDKVKVRDWLAGLKNYEGLTGTWSYDAGRNPTRLSYPMKVVKGEWVADIEMFNRLQEYAQKNG